MQPPETNRSRNMTPSSTSFGKRLSWPGDKDHAEPPPRDRPIPRRQDTPERGCPDMQHIYSRRSSRSPSPRPRSSSAQWARARQISPVRPLQQKTEQKSARPSSFPDFLLHAYGQSALNDWHKHCIPKETMHMLNPQYSRWRNLRWEDREDSRNWR